MKIDILGCTYKLYRNVSEEQDKHLIECDGYTDYCVKKIVTKLQVEDAHSMSNLEYYERKVLRHEVLHAYLYESGLRENSGKCGCWATNEEMVDWFAIQFPKIIKTYKELGVDK